LNSLHGSLHGFLSCFPVMTSYQSQTAFMFSLHVPRHVPRHVLLYVSLYVSLYDSLPNNLHVSPSWLSTKKVMQKDNAKVGKISIFSSLDVKLEFLTSRVELTQFSVESSRVKLKIWAIQLKLSWKCEQLDLISIWVQNVNSKLNSMISLLSSSSWSNFLSLSLFLFLSQLLSLFLTCVCFSSYSACCCRCTSTCSN